MRSVLSGVIVGIFGLYLSLLDGGIEIAGEVLGLGRGLGGYGHGFGYGFPYLLNYTALFEIKCIKKGGTCQFIDDCDNDLNVYFKTCGYNKSVVCCVPNETICRLTYGICSTDREGCTSAGFFWSWFQCNETARCCRPHKKKKKQKKKKKKTKLKGYGNQKKKPQSSLHGGYGQSDEGYDEEHASSNHHDGYADDHSSSSHSSSHGKGYGHSSSHSDLENGYGGFLSFIR